MVNFYMMVGLPGSGKSFYANSLGVDVYSSDAIRAELFGDENDQTHNADVFNELHNRVRKSLSSGKPCVYDAQNISRKYRKGFLKSLDDIKAERVYKIAIVVCTELKVCLHQNAGRDRKVPEDVIIGNYKKMTLPRLDEGWDEIRYVVNPNNTITLDEYFCFTTSFDQCNPHHTLTLDNHLLCAERYVNERHPDIHKLDEHNDYYPYGDIVEAARYHDIGKPVCKTYQTYSGKITEHAHYYNHAEVGAYMYLCASLSPQFSLDSILRKNTAEFDLFNSVIKVASLIQCHMAYFDSPKLLEDIKSVYGEKFVKCLDLLHEADLAAH